MPLDCRRQEPRAARAGPEPGTRHELCYCKMQLVVVHQQRKDLALTTQGSISSFLQHLSSNTVDKNPCTMAFYLLGGNPDGCISMPNSRWRNRALGFLLHLLLFFRCLTLCSCHTWARTQTVPAELWMLIFSMRFAEAQSPPRRAACAAWRRQDLLLLCQTRRLLPRRASPGNTQLLPADG